MKHPHPIQISIPQPCSEDWNKMTTQERGRFCDSCQKYVVDFTGYTDDQLYRFLTKNKNKKTCGLFSDLQVDRPIFKPNSRRDYFQWIMSIGFIVFLTNLIGIKAKAQEPIKKEWVQDDVDNQTAKDSLHNYNGPEPGKVTSENNIADSSNGRYASIDSGKVKISDGKETRTLYIIDGIRIINTKEMNKNGVEFVEPPMHGLPAKYSNYNNER